MPRNCTYVKLSKNGNEKTGAFTMWLNIKKMFNATVRLTLLFCFAMVSLNLAHASQPSFDPSYFVIEQHKVGFQIQMDGLVVQTTQAGPATKIHQTLQKVLQSTFPSGTEFREDN